MRQQVFESFDRMVSNAAENIAKPGKRIDLGQFAGGDKAAQNRCRLAAVIAPEEGPVVPFMYT
jgi:hypothetical protein